jgi:hypothetical protein
MITNFIKDEEKVLLVEVAVGVVLFYGREHFVFNPMKLFTLQSCLALSGIYCKFG